VIDVLFASLVVIGLGAVVATVLVVAGLAVAFSAVVHEDEP
jgi:hypothetical protein